MIERRAVVAEELGIGTAIAFPVLLGEKVAAVLEFFSDRVIQPDEQDCRRDGSASACNWAGSSSVPSSKNTC